MGNPPIPLWSYQGSGALWTPEVVPQESVQVPAGPFPTISATETTEVKIPRDDVTIGDTTVREYQDRTPFHDFYDSYGLFLPPYEQDYAAPDCGASGASSRDSIPPLSPFHGSVSQQTLTHVAQSDSYGSPLYTLFSDAESTPTTSSSWTAVNDHWYPANLVAPWESDVASADIDHPIFSDIDLDTFADGLGSRHHNHLTSFHHAFPPTSAVVPIPLGPAIMTTSLRDGGYTTINHHGGEEYRAVTSESSSSAALTAGQHPWSNPFLSPESSSSITATPVRTAASGPYADVDERRSHGSKVREIVQQDYGKSNRRISYGPNGVSLEEALRGVVGGHSDRIAFEGVEMSQKMSVRYQFKQYRVHKPQVNVLRCARRKLKQPTYRRLAIIAAKEMQRFMDKNKDFPYEWRDLVLLHIDLVSKGSLQPRIGVRLPLS